MWFEKWLPFVDIRVWQQELLLIETSIGCQWWWGRIRALFYHSPPAVVDRRPIFPPTIVISHNWLKTAITFRPCLSALRVFGTDMFYSRTVECPTVHSLRSFWGDGGRTWQLHPCFCRIFDQKNIKISKATVDSGWRKATKLEIRFVKALALLGHLFFPWVSSLARGQW